MQEVKRMRNERGLSQQALADLAGINKVTLIRIEHGTGNPNVETLEKLARALDVEVADFFPKAQAPLWFDDEMRAAQNAARLARWADLLKYVGGMLQDIEGKFDAGGENFEYLSTLAWITATLYNLERPRTGASPEWAAELDRAEGVLRLGVEMAERRAAEGQANVTRLAEYRRKSKETLDALRGTA